jgi:uncharacterized protein
VKPSVAIQLHRQEVIDILCGIGATNISVFGSVLHGTDVEGSDLDLLIDVPEGTTLIDVIQAQQLIEAKLGVRVDLLTAGDLPESFRALVLGEAQLL